MGAQQSREGGGAAHPAARSRRLINVVAIGLSSLALCNCGHSSVRYHYFFATKGGAVRSMPVTQADSVHRDE